MCKVSVIVPIYNTENYLERCIDSLLSQSFIEHMEIILVNDGSTDKSLEICRNYEQFNKCIKVINKHNGGVSSARNAGLEVAIGEFVAFVDGDDFVDNWYYEELYNAAKTDCADLIVFDYCLDFENGAMKKYRANTKDHCWNNKDAMKEFLSGGSIGVNLFDKLFKRELLCKLRFDVNIKIGEDLYYIFEFLKNCKRTIFHNKAGYHYYQRQNSAMNEKFKQKYFDVMVVSQKIIDETKKFDESLLPYAEALYIHSAYKTLERAYKLHAEAKFENELKNLKDELKSFSFLKAKKFLSFKQFVGFCLMRMSPDIYLFVCRIKKI